MRLTEILQAECVKVPLEATEKQSAIAELVQLLADARGIDADDLLNAVWKREQTRTTGIGHGVAIPHGKTSCCESLCMAVGVARQPIEFQAIDQKPVNLIILLASPEDQTGPHIQALARVSKLLCEGDIRDQIIHAETGHDLYNTLCDHDANIEG